jgi:hypothetical protein
MLYNLNLFIGYTGSYSFRSVCLRILTHDRFTYVSLLTYTYTRPIHLRITYPARLTLKCLLLTYTYTRPVHLRIAVPARLTLKYLLLTYTYTRPVHLRITVHDPFQINSCRCFFSHYIRFTKEKNGFQHPYTYHGLEN